MKRKEKAHKENNKKSLWFHSWALYSVWSEFLHFLIMFSHMISSCPAFCKHCKRASPWRRDTIRAQHQCLNRNVYCYIGCYVHSACVFQLCFRKCGAPIRPMSCLPGSRRYLCSMHLFSVVYYQSLRSDFSDHHRRVRWDKAWGKAT